jgi:DNA gyrase/topoisomerase IV subunit A
MIDDNVMFSLQGKRVLKCRVQAHNQLAGTHSFHLHNLPEYQEFMRQIKEARAYLNSARELYKTIKDSIEQEKTRK